MILRDQQVDGAIVVVIASDDGAGLPELDLVETDVAGDVLPSVRAEVAEQADFAPALFGLADGDEVNPAVVVVVEGGDAEGATPQ